MKRYPTPQPRATRPWWLRRALGVLLPLAVAAGLMAGLATCGSGDMLLLTFRGAKDLSVFNLRVKDQNSHTIVLDRRKEPVAAGLDPLGGIRVAVEFTGPGTYLVYIQGYHAKGEQFFIKEYQIDGVVEDTVDLVGLQPSLDADGDGFPACGSYKDRCPPMTCTYLDCNDKDKNIHPFAAEVCGDGKDNDCSAGCGVAPAKGDQPCLDNDKDGVPADRDCDDNDPCRSPNLVEQANVCFLAKDKFPALPQACLDKLKATARTMIAPYCGDGVDQDCSGQDQACRVDEDCDGYSPPEDCNDKDKAVNPGAKEICGDKVDNNCNKQVDEGCAVCDVDGDGYASKEALAQNSCPAGSEMTKRSPDPDDYDAGVHPGTTTASGGKEGGGFLQAALRQVCSGTLETKNSTATGRIYQRDVDHDGDGLKADKDGCPEAKCDADGDGFEKNDPAGGCTPTVSLTDCNDNDPKVFPGAPDYCGDGIAQNCNADTSCAGDKDGDKYPAPTAPGRGGDCNDNDKDVHPWATELCNGVDDDCDGLIDEGNPDDTGKLLATNVNLCNDSNVGKCALCVTSATHPCNSANGLSGVCACSPVVPSYYVKDSSGGYTWPEKQKRVACTGEDLAARTSPRCFGATQKQTEVCDSDDHDCDGYSFDASKPFVGKGQACSKTVPVEAAYTGKLEAVCRAGTITGCDLTRKVAYYDTLVKAFDTSYTNPNWICDGVLPWPEVCNGKDDDCDGKPGTGDIDGDGDSHLACGSAGCSFTDARYKLSSKLAGCADCDDKTATTYPTATEQCDGVDNNCTGNGDEGSDVCTPLNQTCCPAAIPTAQCIDLQTTAGHCGACGSDCTKLYSLAADSCVGGKCVCGTTGKPCENGLNCVGGVCKCVSGDRNNSKCWDGCCSGAGTCVKHTSQSEAQCGTLGATCGSCDDNLSCTTDTCGSGKCSSAPVVAGKSCDDGSGAGTCKGTKCCDGCWSGSKCETGSAVSACGDKGSACLPCSAKDQCHQASCSGGACGNVALSGTSCSDGVNCTINDVCTTGVCAGTQRTCTGDQCNDGYCVTTTGGCATRPKTGHPSCTVASASGKCTSTGTCCTGCLTTMGACVASPSSNACGTAGGACVACPAPPACKVAVCSGAGACTTQNAPNYTECTVGANTGQCIGGTCCAGCVDASGVCQAGTTTSACGGNGQACSKCTTTANCTYPQCTAHKCVTTPYAAGTACTETSGGGNPLDGKCYEYTVSGTKAFNCCTGCWDAVAKSCVVNVPSTTCGADGGNCTPCAGGTCSSTGVCTCSTGCWNASSTICYAGTANTACGKNAATCTDCTAQSKTCNQVSQVCQ